MRARRIALLAITLFACRRSVDLPWRSDAVDPDAPSEIRASVDLGSIEVSWAPIADASGYHVNFVATSGNSGMSQIALAGTTVTIDSLGLETLRIHVTATIAGEETGASPPVFARAIPTGNAGLVPLATPAWSQTRDDPDDRFGYPVRGIGDMNGDGFADVAIGAYQADTGFPNSGSVYVFLGGPAGLSTAHWWTASGLGDEHHFGTSVVGLEADADGIRDLAIGAADYTGGSADEGGAFVFYGKKGDGLDTVPGQSLESNQAQANMGRFAAPVGDLDDDGVDDFAVGVHGWDSIVGLNTGRVVIFYGNGAARVLDAPEAGAGWGWGMPTRSGDLDCDGDPDVLFGARNSDDLHWFEDDTTNNASISLGHLGAQFGHAIDWIDVNGDGCDDILVGAPRFDTGATDRGKAWLLPGDLTGPLEETWSFEGASAGDQLGDALASAGDVNADGYEDALVGAFGVSGTASEEGRTYLFLGGPAGLATTPSWTFSPGSLDARSGGSLASAGDVNGDGSADFLVGINGESTIPAAESRARLFFGPPSRGPQVSLASMTAIVGVPTALVVSIADSAPQGATTCHVDWGDGQTATALCKEVALLTHAWISPGSYVVRVRATNEYGLQGEAAATVRVE